MFGYIDNRHLYEQDKANEHNDAEYDTRQEKRKDIPER